MKAPAFRDRVHAGRLLAEALGCAGAADNSIVLALPRGGVPVAAEVARKLDIPLDVLVVRKLGLPGHEELAMGAIASGGVRVMNEVVVSQARISPEVVDEVALMEQKELRRREIAYRGHAGAPEVTGRTVILVDDGAATGSTLRAAVQVLRHQGAKKIVVAVPVSSTDAADALRVEADELVALIVPDGFNAVGEWYEDFTQTTDDEVKTLLAADRSSS